MKISERSDILRFNKTVVVSDGMCGWWSDIVRKGRKGLVKPIERLTAEM
jgi:hypothetical protein